MNVGKLFFLGFLVGMRSMTLPAVVIDNLATHRRSEEDDFANGLLSDSNVATVTKLMAAGEILADKLPFIPARTGAFPLAERMGVAGFLAAGLAKSDERIPSAVIAGLSAALGSYIAYKLRQRANEQLKGREVPVALAEDALTVGGALLWRETYLDHTAALQEQ